MGEIIVGNYVRTNNGNIGKILNKTEYNTIVLDIKDSLFSHCISSEDIKECSKNIIDLIEVGDYVNGKLIIKILNLKVYDIEPKFLIYDEKYLIKGLYPYCGAFRENDIKSIATKEMFNQVKYEV